MSANNSVDDVDRLEARLRQEPRWREFYKLANAYTRVGRFLDAVRVARHGLKHHPRSPDGHVALGRALFGGGNLAGATEVLRQALAIDATRSEPFRLLGEVLVRRELYAEATILLERAVEAGVADARINTLLERASQALEGSSTQVTRVPEPELDDESRGIGNRAIAGSIGSSTDVMSLPPSGLEPADRALAAAPPVATPPPAPQRSATQEWRNIHESWEEQLDAELVRGLSDTDSDIRMPFSSQGRVELALPPLSDPLAEDMPPLPPDLDEESGLADPIRAVHTPPPPVVHAKPQPPPPPQPRARADADEPTEPPTLVNQKISDLQSPAMRREGEAATVRAPVAAAAPSPAREDQPSEMATQVRRALVDTDEDGQAVGLVPLRATAASGEASAASAQRRVSQADAAAESSTVVERPAAVAASSLLPEPAHAPSIDERARPQHVAAAARATPAEDDVDEPTFERAPIVNVSPPAVQPPLAERLRDTDPPIAEPERDDSGQRPMEIASRAREQPDDGTPRVVPLSDALDSGATLAADLDDGPPPAAAATRIKPRRRRAGVMLLLFVLMLAAGGGGTLLWFHLSAKKAARSARERAFAACVEGSAPALAAASARLAASAEAARAAPARALVAAMAWLFHRANKAPKLPDGAADEIALAKAALALAAAKQVDAQRALRAVKSKAPRARALVALLEGYAAWLGGSPGAALEALGKARVGKQPLALALLLTGHVRRELGEPRAAEQAYRAALGASSRLDLARFALAALAIEADVVKGAEAPAPSAARAPLGRAWAAVINARTELLALGSASATERRLARRTLRQAVARAPAEPALLSYGVHALIASCLTQAADEATTRLAKLRREGDATMSRLRALSALMHAQPARAAKLLEPHEAQRGLARLRAAALVDAGNASKAIALLLPASTQPVALLVRALAASGDDAERARAALLAAAKAKAATPSTRLAAAKLALARGDAARALSQISELAKSKGTSLPALLLLAQIQLRSGNMTAAQATLARADAMCPRMLPVALTRAEIALSRERYVEALAALSSVKLPGKDPRVLRALAVAQAFGGRANQALVTLRALQGHDTPADQLARGEVMLARGEAKAAWSAFKLAGSSLHARVGLARSLLARRRYAAAERVALAAVRAYRDDPRLHVLLGEARRRRGRRTAGRSFRRALALLAKQPGWGGTVAGRAYVGLARLRVGRRKKPKGTIALLQRAIKADPKNALAFRLLGAAQLSAKLEGAARESLTRAVELDGNNATGLFLLGKVQNKPSDVRATWKRFLALEPRGRRATYVRRALRRLRR